MFRHLLVIICIAVSLNVTGQTLYPGGISGCIARWPFGNPETTTNILYDISGNGNSGTPTNITATTGWRGQVNTAGKFDGITSSGIVPNVPMLTPAQFTCIGLVRFDGFYSNPCQTSMLFAKGGDEQPGFYSISITDNVFDNSCTAYNPANVSRGDEVTGMGNATYTTPLQLGKWYFMANTFNGTNLSTYQIIMDSVSRPPSVPLLYTAPLTSPRGANTQDLTIGSGIITSAYPYQLNGALDELIIFNRALSTSEINQIYTYLLGPAPIVTSVKPVTSDEMSAAIFKGNLHLHATDNGNVGEVMLTNMHGQVFYHQNFSANTADVDVSGFPKGIVFVTISRNGTLKTMKVSNL